MNVSRSGFYYKSVKDNSYDKFLINLINEIYTKHPYYGIRRITVSLHKKGHQVNHKKTGRLLKEMGLEAIYPKPKLSKASKEHLKFPYLLKGVDLKRINQVWSSDITYIRILSGFVYLTAIMDWFSRYVLSFELSTSMDNSFCVSALDKALAIGKPEIFNTDQGSQYTSEEFISRLKDSNIRISMDGKGRWLDNIFTERLWRSVKQEKIYINEYKSVKEVFAGICEYFSFYNYRRPHQALGYKTPYEIYSKSDQLGLSHCGYPIY